MSMITVGKLWNKAELAHDTPAQIPAPAELGTCLAQAKATVGYPQTGMMIWVAEMNNWVGSRIWTLELTSGRRYRLPQGHPCRHGI
jgi:hypothetical protein